MSTLLSKFSHKEQSLMITVKLKGRLGNQMFQYALAKKLSITHGVAFDFNNDALIWDNCNYSLSVFNIDNVPVNNTRTFLRKQIYRIERFLGKQKYHEPHFYFNSDVLNLKHATLNGYWQSEKYFSDIREVLLKDFTPKQLPNNPILTQIKQCNAVSIHIRRGDYASNPQTTAFHGLISVAWYQKAIDIIKEKVDNPHFFFFSDDIEWVKEHFVPQDNFYFVEPAPEELSYQDMYMMSQCKHNIIANSSFSWWGAWLNQNPDKIVIAPKQWFLDKNTNTKDVIPSSWIAL